MPTPPRTTNASSHASPICADDNRKVVRPSSVIMVHALLPVHTAQKVRNLSIVAPKSITKRSAVLPRPRRRRFVGNGIDKNIYARKDGEVTVMRKESALWRCEGTLRRLRVLA
jgi:hypothetical protein